jgi:hypothetical protein
MGPLRPHFYFSPSVVADEDPVRPTQQRSCQLVGSSRGERVNPLSLRQESRVGPLWPHFYFSPSVVADKDPVRPTQQRSCQLAGSSRRERVNPLSPPGIRNGAAVKAPFSFLAECGGG